MFHGEMATTPHPRRLTKTQAFDNFSSQRSLDCTAQFEGDLINSLGVCCMETVKLCFEKCCMNKVFLLLLLLLLL